MEFAKEWLEQNWENPEAITDLLEERKDYDYKRGWAPRGLPKDQNHLEDLGLQRITQDFSEYQSYMNKRLLPEMTNTLERYVQRKISGNPGFFRILMNPGRAPGVRWTAYDTHIPRIGYSYP